MAFNTQVEAMFQALKVSYLASGGSLANFTAFYNSISAIPSLVSRFNDAQEQGTLKSIAFSPANGLSNYSNNYLHWDPRNKWTGVPGATTGTITFDPSALSGNGTTAAGQRDLTGAFIAAHEIAHAINATNANKDYISQLNAAATYLAAQPQTQPINVTQQVASIMNTEFNEEARASFSAYNDLITALGNAGQPATPAELQTLASSTGYASYFINSSTGLLDTSIPVQANGLISLDPTSVAAGAGLMRSKEPDAIDNHAVQYGVAALAFMCAQPSNAVLTIDSNQLGVSNSKVSFSDALLKYIGDFKTNQVTQCVIRDTASGQQATVNTSAAGAPRIVVHDPLDPNGPTTSVTWGDDDAVDGENSYNDSVTATVDSSGKVIGVTIVKGGIAITLTGDDLGAAAAQIADLVSKSSNASPELQYGDISELFEMDSNVTGGGVTSQIDADLLSARLDDQGNLVLSGHTTKLLTFDPRSSVGRFAVSAGQDEYGRDISQEWDVDLQDGSHSYTGITQTSDGDVTVTKDPNGPTTIRLTDSPVKIDFVDAAEILANTFGRYIAGDNLLTQTVTSAALKTVADNFGDVLNSVAFDGGTATSNNLAHAFDGLGEEFVANLRDAGIGAVSSYLSAQLVDAIGIHGLPGQFLNTEASQVIDTILKNAADGNYIFKGLSATSLENTAGAFVGTELANTIADWDEVGEQIGAQIGSAIGATIGTAIPIPFLGSAIGAFFGDLIGGLIGGLFTGKPESGAIVGFDAVSGTFEVQDVWKKDGGKKAVARQLGNSAALTLDGIIQTIGGELLNGSSVDAGSYGMRAKSYVYWEDGTASDNRMKFTSASDLVQYGVMQAARQMQFLGGDIYEKRAFYNTLAQPLQTSTVADADPLNEGGDLTKVDFGMSTLLGNLDVANRLKTYLNNSASINALIAAEPDSVFASEWLLTLSQASDLGLLKRNTHDWDGGFSYLLEQGGIDARTVGFEFDALTRAGNGERVMTLDGAVLEDTVDSGSKTVIQGSSSDDVITATSGGTRDGATQDSSYHISNVFHGGGGDDIIRAGDTGDDLFGDSGNDIVVGGALDDWLFGGDGNDVLDAGGGSGNLLSGGAGDDHLLGADGVSSDPMNSGSDWLEGGSGDDVLQARGGDDYLEGGQGNDTIDGGAGNDTVIFRKEDGHDQLNDSGTSTTEHDVLDFGDGIAASDITVVAHSAGVDLSLLVGGTSSGDRIDMRGAVTNLGEGIEEVSFTNGDWSKSDLASHTTYAETAGNTIQGTSADETLKGTVYDDTLNGGGGHDSLSGGDGSDTYLFNLGDGEVTVDDVGSAVDVDTVVFGAGITVSDISVSYDPANPTDIILTIGSNGDKLTLKHQDVTDGARSIEELRFADGISLTLRDLYNIGTGPSFAGAVKDTASVAWDHDLGGGDGADTYSYAVGDGNVRISDSYSSWNDTLVFGAGIRAEDLVVTHDPQNSGNVWIRFANHTGSILLNGQDSGGGTGVEQIQFTDGTVWDRAALSQASVDRAGTGGNDTIFDGASATIIAAGAGDDIVYAGDGDDTITGGLGDDDLHGGVGSDTYVYNLGDGNDRITEGYWDGGNDTLAFGAGITPADLILTRDVLDPRNVLIRFVGHDGSIVLEDQSDGANAGVEQIRFADGTVWDRAAIDASLVGQALSSQSDIVRDGYFGDTIVAGDGNDVVYADRGNDTITGGKGDDDLYGGTDSDTYIYNLVDGNDRITEGYWDGGVDTLSLGAGIAPGDLILTRDVLDPRNVLIRFTGHDGSIILEDQGDGANAGIEQIQFADGTVWDRATLDAQIIAQELSSGNDIIRDEYFGNTIDAGAGNDVVYTDRGNDTITGGTGDDDLYGGTDSDTYIYNLGDGNDRITEGYWDGGTDTLQFGTGIAPADLIVSRDVQDPRNVLIRFAGHDGSIILEDQGDGANAGVEQIQFADGTVWDRAMLDAQIIAQQVSSGNDIIRDEYFGNVIDAGAGNDVVYADRGNDTITGGTGDDDLYGGTDSDTYVYNLGDGNDRITEGYWDGGVDTLSFGVGILPGDLILSRDVLDPRNVLIRFAGHDGSIILEDQGDGANAGIEQIQFADGTIWDRAALDAQIIAQQVSSGNDIIRDEYFGNTIDAGAGNDVVYADRGNDTITGGTGDDDLYGGTESDTYIYNLGDGNDRITEGYWDGGTDTLVLGAGIAAADLILTRDVLNGNNITVSFANSGGSILLQDQMGGANSGIEQIQFADGTLWDRGTIEAHISARAADITGSNGDNDLTGTAGQDQIYGNDGDDTLRGGLGNDFLAGGNGDDTYVFNRGDGFDTIYDDSGNDTLRFGSGISVSDLVLTQATTDNDGYGLFIGIAGTSDRIYIRNQNVNNGRAVERFAFADGTVLSDADMRALLVTGTPGDDRISGTPFADQATGGAGNDELNTGDGNDTLTGGLGDDYLNGQGGDDTYVFNRGDGSDTIFDDWYGNDTLRFGAGISASDLVLSVPTVDGDFQGLIITIAGTSDRIYIRNQNTNGGHGIERFEFADGSVLTDADLRAQLMAAIPTDGDDKIYGTNYDDVINAGNGNDEITSGDGNDTLTGGKGDDYLDGQGGDDTYVFNRGDGSDTIFDDWYGNDTLRFGAGISASDLVLSAPTVDGDFQGLIITIAGTSDRIYIRNQNSNGGHGIERFEFADGTVLTDADLRAQLMAAIPTDGDDKIYGTNYDDVINGGLGDDEITSGDGNDTLTGGKGDDYLDGQGGDDTYVFNRGDGSDTIYDDWYGNDTLRFGAGISASDLILSLPTVDGDFQGLIISIAGTSDRIYIRNQNTNGGHGIERFEFADGTVLTDADLRARLMAAIPTDGDDKIYGTNYADVIDGGNGNDEITSGDGNDTLTGGKGDDYLDGQGNDDTYIYNRGDGSDTILDDWGYDTLKFGEGIDESDIIVSQALVDGDVNGIILSIKGTDDRIYLRSEFDGNRIDQVTFQSGATWSVSTLLQLLRGNNVDGSTVAVTMGDDTVIGSAGNDTLHGMKGDDVLRGGAGSDTYSFARGDGHDTIYDPTDAGSTDTLVLEGINSGDVRVLVSPTDAQDLILYIDDDNVIYLDQQNASASSGIEQVRFADGTVWDRATLTAKASGQGTTGDDTLIGTNFADTLQGGLGNDTLIGSGGNDTYVYNLGDGDDTIVDDNGAGNDPRQPGTAGNVDTLAFGPGIGLPDIRLTQPVDGGPLVINFASQPGSITLKGLDTGGRSGVEVIRFADGSTVTMDQLRASAISAAATAGDDLIRGFATADILDGGAGNDTLAGGAGADTYRFALGGGSDTVVETADGSTNVLAFGDGIAASDIRLMRTPDAPDDLILALANGTDKVTIKAQFANGGAAGIQQVSFADGTIWKAADFEALMLAQPATPGADYLVGDSNANIIDGLAGDDTIMGGDGDDTLSGSDGNDTLYGGGGNDKLYGGTGDDVLSGDTGTDLLDGGDGFDTADYSFSMDSWSIDLSAGTAQIVTSGTVSQTEALTSIEAVIGGLGADAIIGDDGANRLQGGGGNDTLKGAGGDDVFVFDGDEEGVDAIDGGSGNDRIEAASDGTIIGLSSVTGIELITAAGHSDVHIEATDDTDTLDLSGAVLDGIASIDMGAGNDVVTGSLGADVINAGDGDDTIRYVGVSTGGDQVDGGAGTDTIAAGADNTVIRLAGFQNVEAISGAGFADVVLARTDASETTDLNGISVAGIAYIDLAGGDDTFIGTTQADVVRGGAGDDILTGGVGDDIFQYAAADSGHDTIDGGDGYDRLQAATDGAVIGIHTLTNVEAIDGNGFANVTIALGDGDDHLDLSGVALTGIAGIVGGKGDDVIRGSGGDDTFLVSGADQGSDDLDGGAGQDRILAGADGSVIGVSRIANIETIDAGGHANVRLATTDGNDNLSLQGVTLTGISEIDLGAGNDSFAGSSGNDTVSGGSGNDTLSGGAGDDVYLFDRGDGNDVIREKDADGVGGGNDTLRFGTDVSKSDVQVTRVNGGNDYLLTLTNGGGTVLIAGGAGSDSANWIENIAFADGTVWTRDTLDQSLVPFTDGDDNIQGTNDSETLHGGGGNDVIAAYGGDDGVYGDDGNDTLQAGDGNDVLVGGTGNDRLEGGSGTDLYRYNAGDGDDSVFDYGGSRDNRLVFGPGISPDEVSFARTGDFNSISVIFTDQAGSIYLDRQWWGDAGVEYFDFADGTTWTEADIAARYVAAETTAGNDTIWGTYGNDTADGGAGDDTIQTSDGNDTLTGGSGNDRLEGGSGTDIYRYNAGDGDDSIFDQGGSRDNRLVLGAGITPDSVKVTRTGDFNSIELSFTDRAGSIYLDREWWGDAGIEYIDFADGTTWTESDLVSRYLASQPTSGNDTIWGTYYNDTVNGGAGDDTIQTSDGNDDITGGSDNDRLEGGNGTDIYRYNAGDGDDSIFDYGGSRDNRLVLGAGITPDSVKVTRTGDFNSIELSFTDRAGSIYLDREWWGDAGIEYIDFADGTTWTESDLVSHYLAGQPTSGNDTIWGTYYNDTVNGGAGDDTIQTSDGNDDITGGTGNDRLEGGNGTDVYRYNVGDGDDSIFDYGGSRDNRLILGAGIGPDDVQVLEVGDGASAQLVFAQGGSIYLDREWWGDAGIEYVDFADGTTWTEADIAARFNAAGNDNLTGTSGNDVLEGYAGDDMLSGLDGDDTLIGDSGNDLLVGGAGADTLAGGAGNDALYGDGYFATGPNLIVNGSFEDFGNPADDGYPGWGTTTGDMPGWTRKSGAFFKAVGSGYAGVAATDGGHWLDMTSDGGGQDYMDIEQSVTGLPAEQKLLLQFDAAKRDGAADSTMQVLWNGQVIATIENVGTQAKSFSFLVEATGGSDDIEFKTISGPSYQGVSLDNVRLFATQAAAGGDDVLTGGAGNDLLDGGAGNDTAVYAGAMADYSVITSNGKVTITDNQPTLDGDDGTDTLVGIETLQFKDGSTSLASPIVLDLNGDGVHLVSKAASGVQFDWKGEGTAEKTGWISRGDGLLAFDRNGDGTVSGADELSFVNDVAGATSDLAGLAAFDSNGDGQLSAADDAWSRFGVWSDANGDGKVDPGEFLSMAQAGVSSLDLSGAPTEEKHRLGENLVANTGFFTRTDGSTAAFDDVAFAYGGADLPLQERLWGGPLQMRMRGVEGVDAGSAKTSDVLANAERFIQATASFGLRASAELSADNDPSAVIDRHRWDFAHSSAMG
ncbi:calcium-binding protein [Sphingomonas abietis]|uniref:Haemolysin-type calcium binding-related domain-containing protein n=1 Tax=Sphingomonas abietis TaxID=3012344 RepID=A0ABY7NSB8_9SPHN|nr:calcium-binding protein [Sphingomonas abietis]WBO24461.1 hypothetical protein PBT88_10335 [Sphingomonas abietis]